jgi:hypothetical protein
LNDFSGAEYLIAGYAELLHHEMMTFDHLLRPPTDDPIFLQAQHAVSDRLADGFPGQRGWRCVRKMPLERLPKSASVCAAPLFELFRTLFDGVKQAFDFGLACFVASRIACTPTRPTFVLAAGAAVLVAAPSAEAPFLSTVVVICRACGMTF